jgi:hypothetical protein
MLDHIPGQQREAAMRIRALSLSLMLLLAGAGGSAAATTAGADFAVPEGGFVLDAGEVEAAARAREVYLAPGAADRIESALQSAAASALLSDAPADPQQAPAPRPRAFEYSDGYRTRLKIHKYASFAMLPLFIAQYAVGQKLYDGNASDSTRSAHGALAASTAVLFGVNTVTGVWNLGEGRKDPNNRTKRMLHGILMLAADAGFVATGALAPDDDEGERGGNRSTHRTVALTSMGVATVAYLMMLIH